MNEKYWHDDFIREIHFVTEIKENNGGGEIMHYAQIIYITHNYVIYPGFKTHTLTCDKYAFGYNHVFPKGCKA